MLRSELRREFCDDNGVDEVDSCPTDPTSDESTSRRADLHIAIETADIAHIVSLSGLLENSRASGFVYLSRFMSPCDVIAIEHLLTRFTANICRVPEFTPPLVFIAACNSPQLRGRIFPRHHPLFIPRFEESRAIADAMLKLYVAPKVEPYKIGNQLTYKAPPRETLLEKRTLPYIKANCPTTSPQAIWENLPDELQSKLQVEDVWELLCGNLAQYQKRTFFNKDDVTVADVAAVTYFALHFPDALVSCEPPPASPPPPPPSLELRPISDDSKQRTSQFMETLVAEMVDLIQRTADLHANVHVPRMTFPPSARHCPVFLEFVKKCFEVYAPARRKMWEIYKEKHILRQWHGELALATAVIARSDNVHIAYPWTRRVLSDTAFEFARGNTPRLPKQGGSLRTDTVLNPRKKTRSGDIILPLLDDPDNQNVVDEILNYEMRVHPAFYIDCVAAFNHLKNVPTVDLDDLIKPEDIPTILDFIRQINPRTQTEGRPPQRTPFYQSSLLFKYWNRCFPSQIDSPIANVNPTIIDAMKLLVQHTQILVNRHVSPLTTTTLSIPELPSSTLWTSVIADYAAKQCSRWVNSAHASVNMSREDVAAYIGVLARACSCIHITDLPPPLNTLYFRPLDQIQKRTVICTASNVYLDWLAEQVLAGRCVESTTEVPDVFELANMQAVKALVGALPQSAFTTDPVFAHYKEMTTALNEVHVLDMIGALSHAATNSTLTVPPDFASDLGVYLKTSRGSTDSDAVQIPPTHPAGVGHTTPPSNSKTGSQFGSSAVAQIPTPQPTSSLPQAERESLEAPPLKRTKLLIEEEPKLAAVAEEDGTVVVPPAGTTQPAITDTSGRPPQSSTGSTPAPALPLESTDPVSKVSHKPSSIPLIVRTAPTDDFPHMMTLSVGDAPLQDIVTAGDLRRNLLLIKTRRRKMFETISPVYEVLPQEPSSGPQPPPLFGDGRQLTPWGAALNVLPGGIPGNVPTDAQLLVIIVDDDGVTVTVESPTRVVLC